MQRRAMTAVALTLGVLSAPAALLAQSRGPDANTPRLLVAVFAGNDRAAGVTTADAVRNRVESATNIRQLYVIPRKDIVNYLESSGYRADSSLGPSDLKELAKLLRADEVLFGTVTRTPANFKIEPRLLLARDVSLAQPLPAVEVAQPGDAARQIERSLQEARKQLADYRVCENALRDKDYPKAIAAANAGIGKYSEATLSRLCLASAYQAMELGPDSVLRVIDEIRSLDPKNSFALRMAAAAYKQKAAAAAQAGNQEAASTHNENAVRALVAWLAVEPNNMTLQTQLVGELAQLGRPRVALSIVDTLLTQNPGDPQLLRQKWLLTLAAAASDTGAARVQWFAEALPAGEDMVKADTTMADSVYFARQIVAATALTDQPQKAVEFASLAVQKYPNIAEFWALKANAERKAGQLDMARQSLSRALTLNPQYPNGTLLLAQIFIELKAVDSAVAVARRAVEAGEDSKTWGAFLLAPTQAAYVAADAAKDVEGYKKALELGLESDKLSPSETASFFIGIASFQIGLDAIQKAQKPKSCPLARTAQDMFVLTQTHMARGGRVDANTAAQILGYVGQYAPVAEQMVKQYCK